MFHEVELLRSLTDVPGENLVIVHDVMMTVDDVTLNSGADPCVGTFKYLDVQYKCTDRKGESHEHVYRNAS